MLSKGLEREREGKEQEKRVREREREMRMKAKGLMRNTIWLLALLYTSIDRRITPFMITAIFSMETEQWDIIHLSTQSKIVSSLT